MESAQSDVAIVGAGPVGASLALGLARRGLKVCLLDARDPQQVSRPDGRNFAIVTGSWRLLSGLDITEPLQSEAQPLNGLEAVDGGSHVFDPPGVLFENEDLNAADPDETLGYMVQADALQAALDDAVAAQPNIQRLTSVRFESLSQDAQFANLELNSGQVVQANVIIGADGMNSAVRRALGIDVVGRDYGKSVFTANVRLSEPHNGIARQLFLPEGPFATLPLTGNRANLAWYLKRGAAEKLATYPKDSIEAQLNKACAHFAGEMEIEGEAGAYPLILQIATDLVGTRGAIVGDAARRVNPLAGQGLNQGFRDVAALLDVFEGALRNGEDIGSELVLSRYRQARHFEGTSAALILDGIDRLFSNDHLLTKPLRSIGLGMANAITPIRQRLAQFASATEESAPGPMKDV